MTQDELDDYIYDCDRTAPDSPKAPDYQYVVKLVLGATVYFTGGHTPAIRHALKVCFGEYFSAFGKNLQWGWEPQPPGKPTPRTFDQNLIDATNGAFDTVPANDALELAYASSFNPHHVGDYGIACLTLPRFQDAQGYNSFFRFHVPCDTL